jgi:hypothetical protein
VLILECPGMCLRTEIDKKREPRDALQKYVGSHLAIFHCEHFFGFRKLFESNVRISHDQNEMLWFASSAESREDSFKLFAKQRCSRSILTDGVNARKTLFSCSCHKKRTSYIRKTKKEKTEDDQHQKPPRSPSPLGSYLRIIGSFPSRYRKCFSC